MSMRLKQYIKIPPNPSLPSNIVCCQRVHWTTWFFEGSVVSPPFAGVATAELLHQRLGHPGAAAVQQIASQLCLSFSKSSTSLPCLLIRKICVYTHLIFS